MAMVTRLRTKKREENTETIKIVESKLTTKTIMQEPPKEKRQAFGDIFNKLGAGLATDKQKAGGAVYKDVKPRVDTRWKKAEAPAQRVTRTSSVPSFGASLPKPFSKQLSKPLLTESYTAQLKKTTKVTTLVDAKKEIVVRQECSELTLIKSPGSFKLKREKVEKIQNFYESHSSKLLHQVENIDEKDVGNTQMLPEYVHDIYIYLFKLENSFPIGDSYLSNQMDVTPKMRSVLLDWINEVHNQFSLELETYHMAVSMIDRYLQANTKTPRRYLQLVGVTALFMASKYEELMPPEISDFVYVTDDTYSKDQILQMEKKILETLGFNLSKPLPIHFLRRFAKAAGTLGDRQYAAAKYFMELASVDYEMTKYKPSQIAASSLYLSLYIFNSIKSNDDLWTPTLEYYSTYSSEELMPIMKRLASLVATAKDVKLKSAFTKYSHAIYKFISTVPEMSGSKIHEIITRK